MTRDRLDRLIYLLTPDPELSNPQNLQPWSSLFSWQASPQSNSFHSFIGQNLHPSNCLLLLFLLVDASRIFLEILYFVNLCLPQEVPEWLRSSWKECLNLEGKLQFWGTSYSFAVWGELHSTSSFWPLCFPSVSFLNPSLISGLDRSNRDSLICGPPPLRSQVCTVAFLHNGTVCHPLSHIEWHSVTSLKLKSQSHQNRQLCL